MHKDSVVIVGEDPRVGGSISYGDLYRTETDVKVAIILIDEEGEWVEALHYFNRRSAKAEYVVICGVPNSMDHALKAMVYKVDYYTPSVPSAMSWGMAAITGTLVAC